MMTRRQTLYLLTAAGAVMSGVTTLVQRSDAQRTAEASLAKFFQGAEIQAENDAQRKQLMQAFTDMSNQPVPVLRDRRYADYEGTPGKWSLVDLLKHHVVPRENVRLTSELLFNALQYDSGRSIVRQTLADYQSRLQRATPR